jgi:predicted O-methyltransferase YrrM
MFAPPRSGLAMAYQFTNGWFEAAARRVWDQLIPSVNPGLVLEIGSYEGAATCYLIDRSDPSARLVIHCVDTWAGGLEHKDMAVDMPLVEQRFDHNVRLALSARPLATVVKHKAPSDLALAKLLAEEGPGRFDFVYVDGSHQAADVLCDAVLGFRLLRVGGVMVFDDYLWTEALPGGVDPLRCPKPAIDAFTTLHWRQLEIFRAPLYQLYVRKTAG